LHEARCNHFEREKRPLWSYPCQPTGEGEYYPRISWEAAIRTSPGSRRQWLFYLWWGLGFYRDEFLNFDFNTSLFYDSESRAIGRYIALKYANQGTQGLIPDGSDLEATGRFEEACSLEYSQFSPSAEGLCQELIFKKYRLYFFEISLLEQKKKSFIIYIY
jgi:hypothetical protein